MFVGITKQQIKEYYVKNCLSVGEISKKLKCAKTTVYNYLRIYNIPIVKRHASNCQCMVCKNKRGEKHKHNCGCVVCRAKRGEYKGKNNPNYDNHKLVGKNSPNFIDGRRSKPHYCIGCLKKGIKTEISYPCWLFGSQLCRKCYFEFAKGKNNPSYIDGRCSKQYFCKDCGKKISMDSALYGNGRCKSCSHKGKLHCNYKENKIRDEYPIEFSISLKENIKERDNYECQGKDCSMTQEEHYMMYGRDIEVHHIDYNRKNCKETNLITLCKQCNLRANYNKDYWAQYYFDKINFIYKNKEKNKCLHV
jgi:hypothetical protein